MFILMVTLTGCATAPKPQAADSSIVLNHMKIKIAAMEDQLTQKDQKIEELRYEVKELAYQVETLDMSGVIEPRKRTKRSISSQKLKIKKDKFEKILRIPVAPKKVQLALKNAGYYSGRIDGKLGSQTRKAIREFQKDHNLKIDGIIGQKTWKEIKNYLE